MEHIVFYGYSVKKFLVVWLILLAVVVFAAAAAFGFNTITDSVDLPAGFNALSNLLGGGENLVGILVLLAIIAGLLWTIHHVAETDFTAKQSSKWAHIGLCFLLGAAAAFVAMNWITYGPNFGDGIGILIMIIVLMGLVAALVSFVTMRTKKVVTTAP